MTASEPAQPASFPVGFRIATSNPGGMDALQTAVSLMVKSMVLSARWAGQHRLHCLQAACLASGQAAQLRAEVAALRDRVQCLTSQNEVLKARLGEVRSRKPYSWGLRLKVLWHMEYFSIPRRRITQHLAVPRSTFYRWLHAFEQSDLGKREPVEPVNKTPRDLARLVWEIFTANPHWGRRRIAMTIQALGTFIAASTVRDILLRARPKPVPASASAVQPSLAKLAPKQIIAQYPNHVWSMDLTRVYRWGLWPTSVLVVIDHFSRKVVTVTAATRATGVWVATAMNVAFCYHGQPRHVITDQEACVASEDVATILGRCGVRHRLGALGSHGSISVTERVIRTLKQEWLRRVALIRGMDHLALLLDDFATYYNEWRPHMRLAGATPDSAWCGRRWMVPARSHKEVPAHIEQRFFSEVSVTAYRLPRVA